jgi:chromatin remodeling complex protein RSC6
MDSDTDNMDLNKISLELEQLFESIISTITKLSSRIDKLENEYKTNKYETESEPKYSCYNKPIKISEELYNFLGIPLGQTIARTDVNAEMIKYVKKHDLQNAENKHEINLTKPGSKALIELLKIPEGCELTFFNLSTYMKIHYI